MGKEAGNVHYIFFCQCSSVQRDLHFLYVLALIPFEITVANNSKRAVIPSDDEALSLWLIARIGWVYCERAAELMEEESLDFSETRCKQCYHKLFERNRRRPGELTDNAIINCAKNFVPNPEFILRQSFRSIGVHSGTCNHELVSIPFDLANFQTVFPNPHKRFSPENDLKRFYPRQSYVECLLEKIYETEYALCQPNRKQCAEQKKIKDEHLILSRSLPISFRRRHTKQRNNYSEV